MSENNRTIQGWIRPLSMPSLGELPSVFDKQPIESSELIKDLCRDQSNNLLEKILERYIKLTTTELDIFVVPAEKEILNKLVWPLRTAKQDFTLGDYLGCISLCGMACEMATVFIYDLVVTSLNINSLDPKYQAIFIGRKYERFGQERRIKELLKLSVITKELARDANCVREIRREYLHFLSKDYSRIEEDAYKAYIAVFRVIKALVGLPLGDQGKLVIPSHLKSYLVSKGVA
jgi:hypothetical protein